MSSTANQSRPIRILAISGSLRAASSNTQVLVAMAGLAPPDVEVELYTGIGKLPHFSPDLDRSGAPAPVLDLRQRIAVADAIMISSPEYAHGVPGSLKNALDWLVSGVEIVAMPIALLNPSPHSTHATASLAETLRTMSTEVLTTASVTIPLSGRRLDAAGILGEPSLSEPLARAMTELIDAASRSRASGNRLVDWKPEPAS